MFRHAWLKLLSLLLVLSVSLGTPLSLPPAWANGNGPPETLLANGGFESVTGGMPDGWTPIVGGSHYGVSTTTVWEGTYSARLSDPSAGFGIGLRSAQVPAAEGELLKADIAVYAESGSAFVYLEYWNASNQRIGVRTAGNTATGAWERLRLELEAPSGTAYATLLLYSSIPNTGTAYFDDAQLVSVALDSGAIGNGGFESVVNGMPEWWTPITAGSYYASVGTVVYEGAYAVRLTDPSTTLGIGLRSSKMDVEAGKTYTATVRLFNEQGSGAYYLEYWNAANQRIAVHSITGSGVLGQWIELKAEGKAPDEAVAATVLLYSSVANAGVSYFDNAAVAEKLPEPILEFQLLETSHPRLYFTQSELPGLAARSAGTAVSPQGDTGQQLWSRILSEAQSFLNETSYSIAYYNGYTVTYSIPPVQPEPMDPPPGFVGPYPYWASMATALQTRMETLSLAYAVTGNAAYADKAKAIALSLADWSSWTETNYPCGGTCLDTAHLTIGVSTVYDVLYDDLTATERQKLEDALEQLGLTPLAETIRYADNNAHALRASALAAGGAALLGENPNADWYLTKATNFAQWYFDLRMTSGQSEGFSYTDYSVENLIKGVDKMARTTGVQDLLSHPFLDDFIVRWTNYFLAPGGGGLAIFADAGTHTRYYGLLHNTMSIVYKLTGNPYAGWYLSQADLSARDFDKFIYFQTSATIQQPDAWPSSAVFPEVGWAALRSGWSAEDTLLAFNSSHPALPVGHNHYDQNSFQIAVNGEWIARDPGRQTYNPGPVQDFTLKAGHSTVLVDGEPQSVLGHGHIETGMLSPEYDFITGSAPGAYGDRLSRFDRHIVFVKPNYYVILDDLASALPRTYDWVLYGAGMKDVAIDGEAATVGHTVYGNSVYYRNNHSQLTAAFLGDASVPITVDAYPGAENYGYTARAASGSPDPAHRFLTVLKAAPFEGERYWSAAALLPLVSGSSGKGVGVVGAGTEDVLLYRATQTGDYVEFSLEVAAAGLYDLSAYFIEAPIYGRVQAYVNGTPIGYATELYAPGVRNSPLTELGSIALGAGSHTVRFEVVGKDPAADNFYVGINEVRLLPAGQGHVIDEAMTVDAERLEASGVIAAKIDGASGNGRTDYVLFRTGSTAYAVEGIASDARQAVVSRPAAAAAVFYAMTDGTELEDGLQTLLSGAQPFSAQASYDANELTGGGQLDIGESGAYSVFLPFTPATVRLNGQPLAPEQYEYHALTGLLTLHLSPGTFVWTAEG